MNITGDEQYPLPVFLTVKGKKCVIIGGGTVALRKVADLLDAGASTTVVAEKPTPALRRLHEQGKIQLVRRRFRPENINGAFLVFAATDDNSTNAEVSALARQRGILVNVADNPELCNFISGAVVKRGHLQIAISTSGCCPAIAAGIRRELEQLYAGSYGDFVRTAGEMRQYVLSLHGIPDEIKQQAIQWLARKETYALFLDSGKETVWEELKKITFSS